jgi:hypothetical protein
VFDGRGYCPGGPLGHTTHTIGSATFKDPNIPPKLFAKLTPEDKEMVRNLIRERESAKIEFGSAQSKGEDTKEIKRTIDSKNEKLTQVITKYQLTD